MKVYQSKLTIGQQGNLVLGDATNLKDKTKSKSNNLKPALNKISSVNENIKPSKARKDGIFVDKRIKFIEAFTQTESSHFISQDDQSEDSWKSLAEKRREALAETLKENEILTQENDLLKVENVMILTEKKSLQEENDRQKEEIQVMEEMLEEAKQLASLVQEITNKYDESSGHEESHSSENFDQDEGIFSLTSGQIHEEEGITSLSSVNIREEEEISLASARLPEEGISSLSLDHLHKDEVNLLPLVQSHDKEGIALLNLDF